MFSQYVSNFSDETPELLDLLAGTPEMRRLSDVGMHCGCEYTNTPLYRKSIHPYSRLMHSIGVAKIIWRFTKDAKQAAAGLLHDIATPVFAHTIDFMNNDHLTQESTEDRTRAFIEDSEAIVPLLGRYGIKIDDVADYHKYPIADNDTPMLSADRLEYTLGNGFSVYHVGKSLIQEIYNDLIVAENESGDEELCFRSPRFAKEYAEISLRNSHFYVSDLDRFSMQYLADLVRRALEVGALGYDDLYSTETRVIGKMRTHDEISDAWESYTKISSVASSNEKPPVGYSVRVDAKKRYIDPLVFTENGVKRVSETDAGIRARIESFLKLDFGRWLHIG